MINNFKKLMIIAPHPDDEILGCGGLISKFCSYPNTKIEIIIVGGHLPPLYKKENFELTQKECLNALCSINSKIKIHFLKYSATFLKDIPTNELNSKIDIYLKKFKPEILCIPFPDRHVDHRVIFDSSMVLSRPHLSHSPKILLAYETLSETHWNASYIEPNFNPEYFVNIDNYIKSKCKSMGFYKSQLKSNSTRSLEAIKSLARFRGSQNGCKYAEAFKVIRILD